MTMQEFRVIRLQKPLLLQQSTKTGLPQVDEYYFDKLAAFGLACLAAAIMGKLVMTALTPKELNTRDS